jgi:hypothetical protein
MGREQSLRNYLSKHMEVRGLWADTRFCVVWRGDVGRRQAWRLEEDVKTYWNMLLTLSVYKDEWEDDRNYYAQMSQLVAEQEQAVRNGSISFPEALEALMLAEQHIRK